MFLAELGLSGPEIFRKHVSLVNAKLAKRLSLEQ